MIQEFKEFAIKGNMFDMAVGIILGAAFGTVVKSLVGDVIMPVIGFISGGVDFSNLYFSLSGGDYASLAAAQEAGAATINYGVFINNIISFMIVAWVLFLMIKAMNAAKRAEEEVEEAPAEPPAQEVLLGEIRDLLKK